MNESERQQWDELREDMRNVKNILGFDWNTKQPGLAQVVEELVRIIKGDDGKPGLADDVDSMKRRDDRRVAWIAGAVWLAGIIGVISGFLIKLMWR